MRERERERETQQNVQDQHYMVNVNHKSIGKWGAARDVWRQPV